MNSFFNIPIFILFFKIILRGLIQNKDTNIKETKRFNLLIIYKKGGPIKKDSISLLARFQFVKKKASELTLFVSFCFFLFCFCFFFVF